MERILKSCGAKNMVMRLQSNVKLHAWRICVRFAEQNHEQKYIKRKHNAITKLR